MSERARWIGTPCRVRLGIYLVGYGEEGGEEQRERETEWGRRGATAEARDRKGRGLRLEADQLDLVEAERDWA